jgi:nucleotide-binding universal stress UspA family protein
VIARRGRWCFIEDAMKTIVASVDFSDATPKVVAMGTKLAKALGAHLCLFHVVEPEPSYTAYGFTPDEFPALHTYHVEAKRRAAVKLSELLETVHRDVPNAVSQIAEGGALSALLDQVRDKHADLVVLGSHGHGAIAALLLGSVAEGMLRKAVVPTLVVPVKKA